MGMIEDSNKMNLKKLIYHSDCKPSRATMTKDKPTMNKAKTLDSLLTSRSSMPIFVIYSAPFIEDLVSKPV